MKTTMTKITLIAAILLCAVTSQAQKVYATKAGQISFNASSPLEKIAAVSNQTDSKFIIDSGKVVFSVLISTFKFENKFMEEHFNENYMESTKIPKKPSLQKSTFKGFITNIKEVNFSKDGTYPVKLEGDLTIHDVTKKVSVPGTMKIIGGVPEMEGNFKVKLSDYEIKGAYIGEKIAPEVSITVKCKYQ